MNWVEILVIVLAILGVCAGAYGMTKIKKLSVKIKSLEQLVKGMKVQYLQFEKIVQFLDKNPNVDTIFEKVVKYLGIAIEELNEQVIASLAEYETPEQKIEFLKSFLMRNLRRVIIEIEGENSELLDEEAIAAQVEKFLEYFLEKLDLSEFGK